jgi:hypothetical protein
MTRQIIWSGYTWDVDTWGNNSDSTNCVYIDAQNNLHLVIAQVSGVWKDAEVTMTTPVNYGTYTFIIANDISKLDNNVDTGGFYYQNTDCCEIDFAEFWPYSYPEVEFNIYVPANSDGTCPTGTSLFTTCWSTAKNLCGAYSPNVHNPLSITKNLACKSIWKPDNSIYFEIRDNSTGNLLVSWQYPGGVAVTTGGVFEFGNHLTSGTAPSSGTNQDMIISSFNYIPYGCPGPIVCGFMVT